MLTSAVYAKEPIIKEDRYQRVIVKYDGRFKVKWGKGEKRLYGKIFKDKGVLDTTFVPNKKYTYVITDLDSNEETQGSFTVERKFKVTRSAKSAVKELTKQAKKREPILGIYTKANHAKLEEVIESSLLEALLHGRHIREVVNLNGEKYYFHRFYDIKYEMSPKNQKKFLRGVKYISHKVMKGSRKQKVCKLTKWLSDHCNYSYGYGKTKDVYLKKKGICHSFAMFFSLCCEEAGIPCRYVSWNKGTWYHAWNIVKIKGKWYHTDATWDVCTQYGKHLLKGKNNKWFAREHKINSKFYKKYKVNFSKVDL